MKALNDKELKAAGVSLLAANSQLAEVYMAKDGRGFASKHAAQDYNNSIGFKGKDNGALKVSRDGNAAAIDKESEANAKAHEAAVAASTAALEKKRENKKALKEALSETKKGK
jgi:hypothetical protein